MTDPTPSNMSTNIHTSISTASSPILIGAQPNSLGGNTAAYESKGGYIPKTRKTRGGRRRPKKHTSKRRSMKRRR